MEVDPKQNDNQLQNPGEINNDQMINKQVNNDIQAEVQIPPLNQIPEQILPVQANKDQNNVGNLNNANDLQAEVIYISEQKKDVLKKQNHILNEEEINQK